MNRYPEQAAHPSAAPLPTTPLRRSWSTFALLATLVLGLVALAPADDSKKLKRLMKRLDKTELRLLKARIHNAEFNTLKVRAQAEMSLAQALPESTPKEAKAKQKALKRLTKKVNKFTKRVTKWNNTVTTRQRRVNDLTSAIDKIDPNAAPPQQLLGLTPGSLVFQATQGGAAPTPQRLTLENASAVPMEWTASGDAPWLITTPDRGTLAAGASVQLDVSIDTIGLTTGSYEATITADSDDATNGPLLVAVAVSIVPPALQNGLLGAYFDDTDLTDFVQTRVDPNIDFTDWSTAPTGTSVYPDSTHSERWTGYVSIPLSGNWTFQTLSNDGVRLWIDDVLAIDNWTNHSATIDEVSGPLAAGWHSIRLEHYQSNGSVVIQLSADGPGQKMEVIPPERFTTALSGNLPPSVDAGANQQVVLPGASANLIGAANDLDGFIDSWLWTQTSGPAVTLDGGTTATPSVSDIAAEGAYDFGVTVTDDQGATATDTTRVTAVQPGQGGGSVSGTLKAWHRVTVDFEGPQTDESANPNPFRDYRLQVTFQHVGSGKTYVVPGFFAADGQAAETGATAGDVWRAHFTPDAGGTWNYTASFRQGTNVATNLSPTAGNATSFDGEIGSFQVAGLDPDAPGYRSKGRLDHVGDHYLRFAGTGQAWLQGGADSPENLLGYVDFDQTPDGNHTYAPHLGDWNPGDPTWKNGQGKSLIGALNYLASKGMNSVYFLTFNVKGDGDDVWPWSGKSERFRFDVSKLAQWEIVFEHMDDLGLLLHVVTQEQENDNGSAGLDSGYLGQQRKLYYRELVARFGHHLGVLWNLGEENTNTHSQRRDFHGYFEAIDPYAHPVVAHTYPEQHSTVYSPALDEPMLRGATLQNLTVDLTHDEVKLWRQESIDHGTPWIITLSEFGPSYDGVAPDAVDFWHDDVRKEGLWGNLMGGGSGAEWYFGYGHPHTDLTCEDWRSRDHMWELTDIALDFFHQHLPFTLMVPDDGLVDAADAWCLAQYGQVYAVYLKNGGTTQLNLGPSAATFNVRWYDPKTGGALQNGSVTSVSGPGWVSLGQPPHSPGQDWTILLERP